MKIKLTVTPLLVFAFSILPTQSFGYAPQSATAMSAFCISQSDTSESEEPTTTAEEDDEPGCD